MVQVFSGASGFSYPNWRGAFYPPSMKTEQMLGYYAKHLGATELNNTFYRMPKPEALAELALKVPNEFRFAIKAPMRITHVLRLKGCAEPLTAVERAVASLASARGPVLFQLPPNFKLDLSRLEEFLALTRETGRLSSCGLAVEFRHESWLTDAVYQLLTEHQVALVSGDLGELQVPVLRTGPLAYLRMRREGTYSDAELDSWAKRVAELGAPECYAFFRHEATGPEMAAAFRARFPWRARES